MKQAMIALGLVLSSAFAPFAVADISEGPDKYGNRGSAMGEEYCLANPLAALISAGQARAKAKENVEYTCANGFRMRIERTKVVSTTMSGCPGLSSVFVQVIYSYDCK